MLIRAYQLSISTQEAQHKKIKCIYPVAQTEMSRSLDSRTNKTSSALNDGLRRPDFLKPTEMFMQKNLIAALILTTGLISNSHAACDLTPYNAPEDLQVPCGNDTASPAADVDKDQREVATQKKPKRNTSAASASDPTSADKSNKPTAQTNGQ
jgi:hypothetical protein